MTEFLINQIFVLLITIFGLWLGFWVLSSDKKAKTNQLFFLVTILIVLWNIFAYLGFSAVRAETSLIWYRLNFGAVSLFFLVAYYFTQYFPQEKKGGNLLNCFVIIIASLFFVVSTFTDLVVKDVEIKEWGAEIVFGGLGEIIGFKGFSVLLITIILTFFLKKYFHLPVEKKIKAQYFLIGILVFTSLNFIFNIVFPFVLGTVKYQHLGDFSAIFFLGFTAYAIVKQKLFEVKVVLTTLLVTLIAILLLLDAILFTPQLWLQILKGGTLLIFLFFGHLLIKSVLEEIQRRELSEKLSVAKSEFISIASHQLRTPLTAIKGYLSMITEGTYGEVSPKIREKMQSVAESNERLIRLVNELLNLSRIEMGKTQLELTKMSIEKVIQQVVDDFGFISRKNNLYLKFSKPKKDLPELMIDESKIRQILINIIDNSLKYTAGGGVTVTLLRDNENAKIEIRDTGEGISKDELEKIFQSFSRGQAGNRLASEGAGLGLYIARKFVEMHNGKIWAESEGKGKGSCFHILIPIKRE